MSLKYSALTFLLLITLFKVSTISAFSESTDSTAASESPAEIMFSRANQSYLNDRFTEAVNYYEGIINSGFESSSLYYNLGNAYFRLGQIGKAIVNYERALKLNPGDEDIKYNIKFAQTQTVDKVEILPELFLVTWWNGLINLFPSEVWILLFFIFYYLLITFAGFYLVPQRYLSQKTALWAGTIMFFLGIFTITVSAVKSYQENYHSYGIILSQSATVKTSPDENSPDSFIIHEGLKIKIEDSFREWVRIKLSDGKDGWLKKDNIGII